MAAPRRCGTLLGLFAGQLWLASLAPAAAPGADPAPEAAAMPPPGKLTAKQGHQKMMEQRGITSLRRGGGILEVFEGEVRGGVRKEVRRVNGEVVKTTGEKVGDTPVVTKQLGGHVNNSPSPPITVDIQLTLTTPAAAKGGVPVLMEFGF